MQNHPPAERVADLTTLRGMPPRELAQALLDLDQHDLAALFVDE